MSAMAIPLDGVKGRQPKMWASGDDAAVAARIHPMAQRLCESADLVPRRACSIWPPVGKSECGTGRERTVGLGRQS